MSSFAAGALGSGVVQIQMALLQLGLLAGKADGNYGPQTQAAVSAFQKSKGMASDGQVGAQTWAALFPQGPIFPLDGDLNAFAKGIDVSHHQGVPDWNRIRQAGVLFAFLKASEGVTLADNCFQGNWKGALAAGLRRGAYHFFRPQDPGLGQAGLFLKSVGSLQRGDLPPVADLEPTDPAWGSDAAANTAQVQDFLTAIEKGLGVKPMIYTTASFFHDVMGSPTQFAGYPLWVARYPLADSLLSLPDPVPAAPTELPSGFNAWNFWQYTEKGTVPGIFGASNPVDLDLFNGTPAQLQQAWI